MSSNPQTPAAQQFWYSVQSDGAPYPVQFGFENNGVVIPQSQEPWPVRLESFNVAPSGEAGSKLVLNFSVISGVFQGGVDVDTWVVSLAFKAAVDFTKPLPLDQFSAADSSYVYSTPDESSGDPFPTRELTTTYAVQGVTSIPPPQAGEGKPPA